MQNPQQATASFSAALCLSLSPKATFSDILAGPGVWDSTCLCLPILGPQAQAAVLAFNTGAENSHCGPHAYVASTLSSWVISLAHQLCPHKGVTSSLLLWSEAGRQAWHRQERLRRGPAAKVHLNVLPSCYYLGRILIKTLENWQLLSIAGLGTAPFVSYICMKEHNNVPNGSPWSAKITAR